MRYDRGRQSLDRHATYIVATFVTVASINRLDWEFGRRNRSGLELRIGQSVALAKRQHGQCRRSEACDIKPAIGGTPRLAYSSSGAWQTASSMNP